MLWNAETIFRLVAIIVVSEKIGAKYRLDSLKPEKAETRMVSEKFCCDRARPCVPTIAAQQCNFCGVGGLQVRQVVVFLDS